MDIVTAISVSKSLLELGQEISTVVKKAQDSPDVTKRVLLYLDASRAAVNTMGLERQRILTDVRRCDVSDPHQVNALWTLLYRYLHEDNIRPQLESAIRGLGACHDSIKTEAKGAWWRKRNKEAAVETFSNTLHELESVLQSLTSDFYPGGSGMGVQTLVPIYKLISRIRDDFRLSRSHDTELEMIYEELSELASAALRDNSHEDWFRTTGKVEALVAELQMAFSVRVTEAVTSPTGS
jgi:hypothetical protein